jgi:glycosyltransferase involved in cell wall biosynthesis
MAALLSRSRHDWTVFTSHYEPANTFEAFANFKVIPVGDISVSRDMGAVLRGALHMAATRLPLDGFDAYVVWCDGLGPLTTFRNARLPAFCICSTPLRACYDPAYVVDALAQRRGPGRLAYRAFKWAFQRVDRLAWKRFSGVVATSLEVRDRIVRNGLYPENNRLTLCHPGIDVESAPGEVSYDPFFLVPGRISWTKNIELAIDAFLRAGLPAPWRLLVAGFVDRKSAGYLESLRRRASGAPVEFVTNPSDQELNRLYRAAYTVLFPPLNEDWGMAVLEGMLHAKPVVANDSGGPRESVAHGATGWLLPPRVEPWAALIAGLPDRAAEVRSMGHQARLRVERYDWPHFVRGVEGLIESVVLESSPAAIGQSSALIT